LDDSPKAFVEEFRSAILKKRVGQIALAVILAFSIWRLVYAVVYFLVVPVIGTLLFSHSTSILFDSRTYQIGYTQLFGALLEFVSMVIVVFYLNRWIHKRPRPAYKEDLPLFSTVGEPLESPESEPAETRI
jgi:large-conductance mechanosensitive channel